MRPREVRLHKGLRGLGYHHLSVYLSFLGLNFLFCFSKYNTTDNYQLSIANRYKRRRQLQIQIQIQVQKMLSKNKYIRLRKVFAGYRMNIFALWAVK